MKKNYLISSLLAALCVIMGITSVKAETVANYTEEFENLVVSPAKDFTIKKWGRIVDYLSPSGWGSSDIYMEYNYSSTGGYDGSGYLRAGSQELSDYDTGDFKTAYDLHITPAVSGEVSFYLKKNSTYSIPNVKIYLCTKSESGTFTRPSAPFKEYGDTEITSDTEWTKITLTDVPAGSYLGFRLHNVAIDHFTAASAEVEMKRSLQIASVKLTSDQEPIANAENMFTLSYEVTVTNNGDVDLKAGDENYSVSIINFSQDNAVVATKALDFPLAVGETSQTFTVAAELEAFENRFRFDIKENLKGTTKSGIWIEPVPYVPELILCLTNNSNELTQPIGFGLVREPVSKELRIRNNGGAPLVITAIDMPQGYSHNISLPLTIEGKGNHDFILTLGVETAGNKSGNITFTANDITPDKSYALSGLVLSPDNYYESFETGAQPGNVIFGDGWSVAEAGPAGNKHFAEKSTQTLDKMITPLLTVKQGEALTFFAAKRGANSALHIHYSADRQTWTTVKTILPTGDNPDNTFATETDNSISGYNNYAFKQFTVTDIPEGNWCFAFEAGYARVDDIFGFRLAEVEHDLYLTGSQLPLTGTVNYDYTASLTATNLNSKAEAAGSYTATLYFGDEAVATAEAAEWPAGESKTFNFTCTPHVAGTYTAHIEIAAGDYSIVSPATEVTIAPERAISETVVGTTTSNNSNSPFAMNWKNSETEVIYTKDLIGLNENAKVVSLAYDGYCTADKDVDFNIRIWMENTEDGLFSGTFTPHDTLEMTLVYTGTHKIPAQGSPTEMVTLLNLPLNEAFVYTGGNLRVLTMSKASDYKSVSFASAIVANATYYYRSDSQYDRTTVSWSSNSSMPVVRIGTEKEVLAISGTVTDGEGAAVADAVITLKAGHVEYAGTSGADGAYSIDVFQTDKEYTLTVAKDKYTTVTEEGISFAEGSITGKDITLTVAPVTGLHSTDAPAAVIISGEAYVRIISPAAGEAAVYNLAGMLINRCTITAGNNELALPAGSYIIRINEQAYKVIVK